MATNTLAVAVKRGSSGDGEFLLVRQTSPPMPPGEEYQTYADSPLWDLPSAPLSPLPGDDGSGSRISVEGADLCSEKLDLSGFDVDSALQQALSQVGMDLTSSGCWKFWKYCEDAEFGPGPPMHTVFVVGKLVDKEVDTSKSKELGRWITTQSALKQLVDVKPSDDRIGPLIVVGFLSDSLVQSKKWGVPPSLHFQEYPPGVAVIPMRSKTAKPFWTTNLVVVAPDNVGNSTEDSSFVACGDSLVMDPGCCSEFHFQLEDIITALPRKLLVFVTHHHHDHIDGLLAVQRSNPDAILVAHEKTMARIGKDKWALGRLPVFGGEKLYIGGQSLEVIYSPGHTDGHLAFLHVNTNSLVVGDHCVGQGSALLDANAGGNMKEYFESTYKFLELTPHVVIPMHGRYNLWPKQMLCGYLKHRRDREVSILKIIESGATTLFDVVSKAYANADSKLWLPASWNVRLHVEHLAYQNKLPKEFSMSKWQASCHLQFFSRWLWSYLKRRTCFTSQKSALLILLLAVALVIFPVPGLSRVTFLPNIIKKIHSFIKMLV